MDYKFEETENFFDNLLSARPKEKLDFNTLDDLNFKNNKVFSNFAYFIFCCEFHDII